MWSNRTSRRPTPSLQPGDEVFGTADGSFAEYVTVKATRVVSKPAGLTFEQAATVPVSACTALKATATVHSGQRVLVIGGGVARTLRAALLSPFVGRQLKGLFASAERTEDLLALKELLDDGRLRPVLDRAFPLSKAISAIAYVQRGDACGKVVVTV